MGYLRCRQFERARALILGLYNVEVAPMIREAVMEGLESELILSLKGKDYVWMSEVIK